MFTEQTRMTLGKLALASDTLSISSGFSKSSSSHHIALAKHCIIQNADRTRRGTRFLQNYSDINTKFSQLARRVPAPWQHTDPTSRSEVPLHPTIDMLLTPNSCRTSRRILTIRRTTLQAQPARACQRFETPCQRLCADCEKCLHHPHQHHCRR